MKMMLPPKLMEIVRWVVDQARAGRMIRIIMKGPRGGGKSRLVAGLQLWLWRFQDWDAVNLGGSLGQAQKVYDYMQPVLESAEMKGIVDHTIQSETTKIPGAGNGKIYVLAASSTQVRSPHAGDQGRGGVLVIDEACEAEDDIIESAEPIINSAHPSAEIMSSTFHKAFGVFQERWERADENGWKRFEWDCFDVAEPCQHACQGDEWARDGGTCPVSKYCQTRARNAVGWMSIAQIIQDWRDHDQEWFEVEMMGWKPSTGGLVYDPERLKKCIAPTFPWTGKDRSQPTIGIDWGLEGETCLVLCGRFPDTRIWVERVEYYTHIPDTEIIQTAVAWAKETGAIVFADSSHNFQNLNIKRAGPRVEECVFGTEKDPMIRNLRALQERDALRIPQGTFGHNHLISQLKGYRRNEKTGKPVKKDDHGPDALICACKRYDASLYAEGRYSEINMDKSRPQPGTPAQPEPPKKVISQIDDPDMRQAMTADIQRALGR